MESLFATDPLEEFKTVSKEIFNHLCDGDKKPAVFTNSNTFTAANQEFKQLIIDCNFDLDEVAAVLKTKPWDQDKIEYFIAILQERRIELLYAFLTHGNSSHGEVLSNFNWVLKLVLGTSELKSLKYPIVQLLLHTEKSDGNKDQRIYELSREALNNFINVLENIRIN